MLSKKCENCSEDYQVKDNKNGRLRRFCGPVCSRRWASNNRSESWRKKASEAKQGKNNPMYGVKQTNTNSIKNLRNDYWIGKKQSAESNQKRSKAMTGRTLSEETKRKIGDANRRWTKDDPEYHKFTKYRRRVYYWTNKNDLEKLENYNQRSRSGYQLDHKYSIMEGFNNNIPPKVIGAFCNLEMLSQKDNASKGSKCSITKGELHGLFGSRH